MTEITQHVYTERKTAVGVLIGGPIAGAYYFWRTFRAVGMATAATIAPIGFAVLLIIAIGSIFMPAFESIPNFLFWGIQIGVTYGLFRGYLADQVEQHLSEGKPEFGWGNTLSVAIISMLLTLGIITGILYFAGGFNGSSVRYFGPLRHEIAYDDKSISADEVDQMGTALTKAGFFDDAQRKTVDLAKDSNRYVVNIYCEESARDPEFMELVKGLRQDVQFLFPGNPIIIDLVIGTPSNRIARIE